MNLHAAIRDNIARFGLHVQAVFPGTDEPRGTPDFAYTIGLFERYGYELIVIGLPLKYAHPTLNHVSVYLKEHGVLRFGEPMDDFLNLPVQFRICDPALVKDYGCQAFYYYERDDVPFVQMVLCDKHGLFPGDPRFDVAYMGPRQPLLYPVIQ